MPDDELQAGIDLVNGLVEEERFHEIGRELAAALADYISSHRTGMMQPQLWAEIVIQTAANATQQRGRNQRQPEVDQLQSQLEQAMTGLLNVTHQRDQIQIQFDQMQANAASLQAAINAAHQYIDDYGFSISPTQSLASRIADLVSAIWDEDALPVDDGSDPTPPPVGSGGGTMNAAEFAEVLFDKSAFDNFADALAKRIGVEAGKALRGEV